KVRTMSHQMIAVEEQQPEEAHPLDRLTQGGWGRGVLRLGVGGGLLALVLALTGPEALGELWKVQHLPLLLVGALLSATQRVVRVGKWAGLVEQTELLRRPLSYLVRIQFVGLLVNVLVPLSEVLKMWAVCRNRSDTPLVLETLTVDIALLSATVGVMGLGVGAALAWLGAASWWVWLPGGVLATAAVAVLATVRWRSGAVQVTQTAVAMSVVEALCLLGVYGAAMASLGLPMEGLVLVAVYPLLYLSHLVALTPSGLGLREGVFALVFAGMSETPMQTAAAVGLMVSAMHLVMTLVGGALALALPGRSLRERPPAV
ncbi:MAG: lysylphosphatidylglycerol synthase domain-containing protein, partial [Myxococcota bacterium]